MPVSSLVIRTHRDKTEDVLRCLQKHSSVVDCEMHGENIVLVTDTCKQKEDKKIWEEFEQIPGVLQCDLIYHNFEDEEGFKSE